MNRLGDLFSVGVLLSAMMRQTLISALVLGIALAEYTPGEPGGAWTQEELLIVKAKIWALLSNRMSAIPYNNAYYSYKDVSWHEG